METVNLSRDERLGKAIEVINSNSGWDVLASELPNGIETAFTEMVEFGGFKGERCLFTHFFEDDETYEVHAPKDFRHNLRQGDVFLVTLGLQKHGWVILYCSPRYEECFI